MVTSLVIGGAILGLLIGSFINVVAYRIPNGISVITPPSACPACAHEIRPRDNVPVLGWLLLRGRCRDCAELISVRYPIVEVATAVLFALTPVVVGAVWAVPAYWWFVGVTVTLVLTDLDYTRIPNRILYPGTIVATVLLAIGAGLDDAWSAFGRAVAGGAGYFVLLLAIALIARGGFGFGDVKLAFLLGLAVRRCIRRVRRGRPRVDRAPGPWLRRAQGRHPVRSGHGCRRLHRTHRRCCRRRLVSRLIHHRSQREKYAR